MSAVTKAHREAVCRAYNGDDCRTWDNARWIATGDPGGFMIHMERLAQALADIEAAAEARVRAEQAEAGKAQTEWTVCRHGYMPRAGEKVMFWCRGWLEGATPGLGTYNGDFWEDETQTDNDGCFKLIPGSEVTHWTLLPKAPPSAPEGK